uniref:Uncharacterized protein n=1 Tax=Anguilla anguilla TaxID=7936 RepID=A0A0E9QLK0_ANGAN
MFTEKASLAFSLFLLIPHQHSVHHSSNSF